MTPDQVARGTSPPTGGLAETDLADWLTVAGAAAAIRCSKRTIERLAASRKLEQRLRPQAGSPAVAVYNPDDVARIASERRPAAAAFVLPPGVTSPVTPGTGNGHGRATDLTNRHFQNVTSGDPMQQLCAFVLHSLQSPPSPPVAGTVAERPAYVAKAEALTIAGVSYGALRAAVRAGEVKQRGTRYRRKDLEAL